MLIVSLEYFCPIKTDMIHYIDPIYNKDCTTLTNKIQPSNHHHAIITKRPNFYTLSTFLSIPDRKNQVHLALLFSI